jgi:hypothetical protein
MKTVFAFMMIVFSVNANAAFCNWADGTRSWFEPTTISDLSNCTRSDGTHEAHVMLYQLEIDALAAGDTPTEEPAPESTNSLPEPEAIAEAVGAGFVMMLPLMAMAWGGRQIISMFRAS